MSVPPNLTTPPNPTAPGFTHHMHHLGSFHPTIESKTMSGHPGLGAHHQYYQWDRSFRHGCNRAPVGTKVFWFLLGVGATTIFTRHAERHHHSSPFFPPHPDFSSGWRCRTSASSRPPWEEFKGMTVDPPSSPPIHPAPTEPKARTITREEAIKKEFEDIVKPTVREKYLGQINEVLSKMDEDQLDRFGRMVKEFA